jgi:hypothetical protein
MAASVNFKKKIILYMAGSLNPITCDGSSTKPSYGNLTILEFLPSGEDNEAMMPYRMWVPSIQI